MCKDCVNNAFFTDSATSAINSMMIITTSDVRQHVDGVVQPTANLDMQKFIVMSATLTSGVKNVLIPI